MNSEPCVVAGPEGERRTFRGRAIDVRDADVDPSNVVAAIDHARDVSTATDSTTNVATDTDRETSLVRVETAPPGRWWPKLADPTDDTPPLSRLVAAARSRGHAPPELRRLATAERELAGLSVAPVDVAERRRRVAETGAEVERLREEAATIRGRLQARRAVGADTADAEAALAETMRKLSEAETDRLDAEQAHASAERTARTARSERRRRLELQDRVANRRRDARRALVDRVAEAFEAAVERLAGDAGETRARPEADSLGPARLDRNPLGVAGDPVTAGLAAARVATLDAPVVLAGAVFPSAVIAAETLDAPVVRC